MFKVSNVSIEVDQAAQADRDERLDLRDGESRNQLELGSWISETIGYNEGVRTFDVSKSLPIRFSGLYSV